MISRIYVTFMLVCLAIVLIMAGILALEHADLFSAEKAEALTRLFYTFGMSLIRTVMIAMTAGAVYFIFLKIKDEFSGN